MNSFPLLLTLLIASSGVTATKFPSCAPFPSSLIEFSSGFKEPLAPLVRDEYTANFIQHKWNRNLSHITAGYISNSPSVGIVVADEASDSGLASSLFNYANTTQDGLVDNTLKSYSSNSSAVEVWRGYVNSGFPLFSQDFLVTNNAIFGGLVKRRFNEGYVASWNIMYQGAIPVTVYVNNCNCVVGYDFFATGERTKVITEYFNIQSKS
ncbi:hypothetical protein N7468_006119 [Penicillium chermesinum]|uniref:Uncharacterized protein n=1 Tax=Penicillium chermesinum TaxID=63820 RepID=A0A9W9P0J3_9EURO|nr:uncharacterized protein N7468_006119 [Penicillium chermesinum]KAJ5233163.1 hypothetical protein N7468_006119 [Penicillium chermesinum]KAJ6172799.1 hypothetical protein N7470_001866 [Penicillium chermesinum]